jgi:hypothetical protein
VPVPVPVPMLMLILILILILMIPVRKKMRRKRFCCNKTILSYSVGYSCIKNAGRAASATSGLGLIGRAQ